MKNDLLKYCILNVKTQIKKVCMTFMVYNNYRNISYGFTVVVLRMMSTSSLSSGTTSSTKRGMVGTTGGGVINAAFLALKRNLQVTAAITHCT